MTIMKMRKSCVCIIIAATIEGNVVLFYMAFFVHPKIILQIYYSTLYYKKHKYIYI